MGTDQLRCKFLNLPDELRLNVVSFLECKRDLYNLSLTAHAFEDVVLARLYSQVDLEIPQDISAYWRIGNYSLFRPHVVQSMKDLSVRIGPIDTKSVCYNRRRKSDAGNIDARIRHVIEEMPEGQLSFYRFLHHTATSAPTLHSLASKHQRLRTLEVFELENFGDDVALPCSLQTLKCHQIGDGVSVGKLIEINRGTLDKLHLGQEKGLDQIYRRNKMNFLGQIQQPNDNFGNMLQLQNITHLRELNLCGIDLRLLIPATVEEASHLCSLTRLSLESCSNNAAFLEALVAVFVGAQNPTSTSTSRTIKPQLSQFLFRCEAPSNNLKETLIRFLASFKGLQVLSILFENAVLLESVSVLIGEHGPTLRTLVLESRIQPRESLSHSTSRPFGGGGFSEEVWEASMNDICRLCPNLVELGTAFPWGNELLRLRKTGLPALKYLKTFHIRNFPESQVLSQLGDYTIKEYADKFVEWIFPPSKGGSKPSLETLAIGPTLHETRWRSNPERRQPPEYLRTHFFCLDFGKTRFGRWSPMITAVSEKCMEELREERPLGGVFEQMWLL